jgi:hypothetical protein
MIKGIENFESKLQKAILEFIATNVDMSEDVEIEEIDDHIISINGQQLYVITDAEEKDILTKHNKEEFDDFFDNLEAVQLQYVNEDLWEEDYAIMDFIEWLQGETQWVVDSKDYYGNYNFYEIH